MSIIRRNRHLQQSAKMQIIPLPLAELCNRGGGRAAVDSPAAPGDGADPCHHIHQGVKYERPYQERHSRGWHGREGEGGRQAGRVSRTNTGPGSANAPGQPKNTATSGG